MPQRRKAGTGRPAANETRNAPERELIVVARRDFGLRARREGITSVTAADVSPLNELLRAEGARLEPLFGTSEERLQARMVSMAAEAGGEAPDLSVYYRAYAPGEDLEGLAQRLLQLDAVAAAYVKPPAELPEAAVHETAEMAPRTINDMVPSNREPPPSTPDFVARQGYLDPAPGGIDARYAWTQNGGAGAGVRIIDIEGAWRFTHEDLLLNQGGVVAGTPSTDIRWRNHGTAVVGEFGGDRNSLGITGICPDANVRAISIFGGPGSAGAIREAADGLSSGDVILIELHRPGPRFNFEARDDQRGYIAIEWWPDDFDAIRYATSRGVIVVEAAGNGAENLDDALYETRPAGFPSNWTNPFNRNNRDSGAILAGAGAPPPGTHGRDHGPDRSRLDFSNWGALIDAQGWGREVTTTGYGDLQGGADEDEWYTDRFSGTSSASPIVVGALACVQGILRAMGRTPLDPAQAKQLLRTTGSPQQDAPGRPATQRIGNRPDLRQMITAVTQPSNIRLTDLEITRVGNELRYSGVYRSGTGAHGLWVLANWSSFIQKWQEWSGQGLRLKDLEITPVGNEFRYSGVFGPGSGGYGLWVLASWSSFVQKWQQWSAQGLRLTNLEITPVGNDFRYSGVFNSGAGGYGLWVLASWSSFVQKWQEWSAQGLRLIDLEVTPVGGEYRYTGVFGPGTGGYGLWVLASWSSFVQKWQQWSAQGLRLIDLEVTPVGGEYRYSGVFGPGSGGYALWALANWSSFVQKWQEWSFPVAPSSAETSTGYGYASLGSGASETIQTRISTH
jgi:hypothetical protein